MREGISWDLHKNAVSPEERPIVQRGDFMPYPFGRPLPLREFPDKPAEQSSWIAHAHMYGATDGSAYVAELISTFRPHDSMDESYIESLSGQDTTQGKHGQYLFNFTKRGLDEDVACWDNRYRPPIHDMSWIFKRNGNATSPGTIHELGQEMNGHAGGAKRRTWTPIDLKWEEETRSTKLMWLWGSVPPQQVRERVITQVREEIIYYKPYKPGDRPPAAKRSYFDPGGWGTIDG
ncbi:hypothetical protein V8F06_004966 [Rhypophila decipiens]